MKKSVLIAIIATAVLLFAAGSLYYYYYIDTVSDYFLVKYIPPQPRESIFGGREYSDPKFEISRLNDFNSDGEAVEAATKEAKDDYAWFLNEYDKELSLPKDDNPAIQEARINSITSLLEEERILIRVTHIRSFDPNEVLKMIQEHWVDKSLDDYAKSKNLDVAIYSIPKI